MEDSKGTLSIEASPMEEVLPGHRPQQARMESKAAIRAALTSISGQCSIAAALLEPLERITTRVWLDQEGR